MKIQVRRSVCDADGYQVFEVIIPDDKAIVFRKMIGISSRDEIERFIEKFGVYGNVVESQIEVTATEFDEFEVV